MILVDTDVLSAHLRGHEVTRDWLRQTRAQRRLATSAVTVAELTSGIRSAARHTVERLGLELATLNVRHYPMLDGLEAPFQT